MELLKSIADISHCSAFLYTPDISKPQDKVRRIIEISFHNNAINQEASVFYNITTPDEKAFYKLLVANRVKLLCGRRKYLEYAGKLLLWFEEIATEVTIPRERGFVFVVDKKRLKIAYVAEKEVTWEVLMGLCV